MIDLNWLLQHPANQFATECLRALKEPLNSRTTPLFQLATEWLRRASPKQLPHPEYQGELLERAEELEADRDQVWAASLLVPDYERLERGAERLASPSEKYALLAQHLSQLLVELKQQPTVLAAGKVLAENLYHSLRHTHPSFGHLSGSQ
jgi:hypothetical protein